ncbi:hypothetical protein NE237_020497 [Protea cynaroides]|uniref:Uncharacterized protein n=1 Tax=Protea cynaroides TaxID=273540 RepID=A0A9Q0K2M8_9MAGN|nr:hypothetical protein NE237_020497 [Protea cynaroides]
MEANRKPRGFIKGNKLIMTFYRAAKPSSTVQFNSNKVKPTPSTSMRIRVDQDFSIPAPKQKVSLTPPDSVRDSNRGQINSLYGGGGDENVDMKATSYISYVQERFRLEQAS